MPQIAFEFIPEKSYLEDDFIVSSSNIDAFRFVTSWPRLWESKCLIISGEKACGKTFLARIWQEKAKARFAYIDKAETIFSLGKPQTIIIEDIDKLLPEKEEQLFHLYNTVMNSRGYLLLTTSTPLISLPIKLPDLKSRLSAANIVNISQPDSELLKGLIFKQFSDLQVSFQPGLTDFLIPRIERSFEAVSGIVEEINKKSFETQRNITIPFVKEILGL